MGREILVSFLVPFADNWFCVTFLQWIKGYKCCLGVYRAILFSGVIYSNFALQISYCKQIIDVMEMM